MKKNRLLLLFACVLAVITGHTQAWKKLHQKSIVADTHNDFPSVAANNGYALEMPLKGKTHTDLQRLQEGGVDVQVWSIFCGGNQAQPFDWANREMDSVYAWVQRNPGKMSLVKTPAELQTAIKQKKIANMMGVEGGHMIENDLVKLQQLFDRGARYMTLTWNNSTDWASSAMDETKNTPGIHKGLSDFGKEVVRKMNTLGMMVDLSHVGEQTFYDVMATTTKPVLVSHSCVHAICPVFRNLKDDQIKAIAKNGGVIHLNFYSGFLDSAYQQRSDAYSKKIDAEVETLAAANASLSKDSLRRQLRRQYAADASTIKTPLSAMVDHIDYIVKLAGIDHVGLGSDFDGVSALPEGIDDVTSYPLITKALLERGYSKKDIRKILGENFIRLFNAVQP